MDAVLEAWAIGGYTLEEGALPRADVALHAQSDVPRLVILGSIDKVVCNHLLVLAGPDAHLRLQEARFISDTTAWAAKGCSVCLPPRLAWVIAQHGKRREETTSLTDLRSMQNVHSSTHLQVLLQQLCIVLAVADIESLDALDVTVPRSLQQLGVLGTHTRDVRQTLGCQGLNLSLRQIQRIREEL